MTQQKTGRFSWNDEKGNIIICKEKVKELFDNEEYDILYEAMITDSELSNIIMDTIGQENHNKVIEHHFKNL